MAKKKQGPRTVEERSAALADKVDRAIGRLQLAAEALRVAMPHEDQMGYFERCWDHIKNDIKGFSERTVFSANIEPGSKVSYAHYGTPEDVAVEMTTKIHTPRPTSADDHANKVFCRAMHRALPQQFTDEWDAWKTTASDVLRECAGARDALQERVRLAETNAAALLEENGIEAKVTKYGDLIIPREFDPRPDIKIGDIDEDRMKVVERTIWGYRPEDRPQNRDWTWDDRDHKELYEYGPDDNGDATLYHSEHHHGLTLAMKRVYQPPAIGEHIRLDDVPRGHWYRSGRAVKDRTGKEAPSMLSSLVVYAGQTKPEEQLALL